MHRKKAVAAAPRVMERRISRGFTLIELLVVVGIIAVLMAVLLPALGRARQEVLKVSCASNLRQWGTSLQTWASDHNNHFPRNGGGEWLYRGNPPSNGGEYHRFVAEYLIEYDLDAVEEGENVVMFCPTTINERFHSSSPGDASTSTTRITFGYKTLPNRNSPPGKTWHGTRRWVTKMHYDGSFSEAPIMTDLYIKNMGLDDPLWSGDRPYSNHMSPRDPDALLGSNHLFEDASVQWYQPDEIALGANAGNRHFFFKIDVPGLISD